MMTFFLNIITLLSNNYRINYNSGSDYLADSDNSSLGGQDDLVSDITTGINAIFIAIDLANIGIAYVESEDQGITELSNIIRGISAICVVVKGGLKFNNFDSKDEIQKFNTILLIGYYVSNIVAMLMVFSSDKSMKAIYAFYRTAMSITLTIVIPMNSSLFNKGKVDEASVLLSIQTGLGVISRAMGAYNAEREENNKEGVAGLGIAQAAISFVIDCINFIPANSVVEAIDASIPLSLQSSSVENFDA